MDNETPETEADGIRAGTLRRLRAHHQSQAFMDQTHALSKSPSNTPATTESPSDDKPNTPE